LRFWYHNLNGAPPPCETIFELAASNIRYGQGAAREVGIDLKEMSAKRVVVVTDKNLEKLPPMRVLLQSLDQNGIVDIIIYSNVRVEPSALQIGTSEGTQIGTSEGKGTSE
jgi:hydroxyacid-oxoacid transhydrogenase